MKASDVADLLAADSDDGAHWAILYLFAVSCIFLEEEAVYRWFDHVVRR